VRADGEVVSYLQRGLHAVSRHPATLIAERFASSLERQNRRPKSADMVKVIGFAIFSTRRQEEITRIKWVNLDGKHSRCGKRWTTKFTRDRSTFPQTFTQGLTENLREY
jgi:hypothetical protein